ncbi:hypothetical protein [Candidatus Paracaedibacter symbiosus]|uniref:hypothetical protein n=1 Tax=Candidatus Paracaedibacter symbiosus TaxID=244582 RepID=UPI00068E1AB0|nr:hypothetical protein [Candidatus Paracaedibacter symbiosus]
MTLPLISAALGLTQFAPSIAKWLGGNEAEKIATTVVDLAKKVTGEDDSLVMIQKLHNNPNLVIDFQKAVIQLESELEFMHLRDRQDARARDTALNQSGRINIRADIMVTCAAGGLISCLVSLAWYCDNLPGEAVGIISTIAGIFGACLKDAYAFEFGSSRGSKIKDTTVANIIERNGL